MSTELGTLEILPQRPPSVVRLAPTGSARPGRCGQQGHQAGQARLSVLGPRMPSMTRYIDEDLGGAEFRECDLTGARLIGVVMRDAVIDGLVTNLVVNGVEVSGYVEAELDRRHPVRVLIRSEEPTDLLAASRQLRADWIATVGRMRRTPGVERRSVNDEWSAAQTMRHLVFVHDSWFRRCCLGSTELFTPMGIGPTVEPYREAHGLDLSLDPDFDEIVSVRAAQAAELEAWLADVTVERLAAPAPVPDDDVWPPYARGRSVRQCLGTVLNETFEHHGFCVRDLDLIEARDAE
ncbi:DinB family protein [Actinophytocola xinjiangensis]|nr:DinB family protein [Actinophytocola xinjiangensis]